MVEANFLRPQVDQVAHVVMEAICASCENIVQVIRSGASRGKRVLDAVNFWCASSNAKNET